MELLLFVDKLPFSIPILSSSGSSSSPFPSLTQPSSSMVIFWPRFSPTRVNMGGERSRQQHSACNNWLRKSWAGQEGEPAACVCLSVSLSNEANTLGIYNIDVLIFYRWCRRKSRLLCVTQSYSIPPPLYHHPPMAITLLPLVGFWCLILRTKLNW